jgi:hypothetical protein
LFRSYVSIGVFVQSGVITDLMSKTIRNPSVRQGLDHKPLCFGVDHGFYNTLRSRTNTLDGNLEQRCTIANAAYSTRNSRSRCYLFLNEAGLSSELLVGWKRSHSLS